MSSILVTLVQQEGVEVSINDAVVGDSLMETARSRGVVGILGDCGGGCACATCHVYVEPEWESVVGYPDDIEDMTLDMISHVRKSNSRLSCQIKLGEEMDGLRVAVAPID